MSTPSDVNQLIDHLFRKEYGKIVSYLTTIFGVSRLSIMEDIAQEALLEAYKNWSYHGIPPDPSRWIFKVAKNKAINFSVREQKKASVYKNFIDSLTTQSEEKPFIEKEIQDGMLQMIFACASLKLSLSNKVILVLNILCGFTRKEIAHVLLMEEETVKKRLFRAKKEIREKDMPWIVPKGNQLQNGLEAVLSCLYLLFLQE